MVGEGSIADVGTDHALLPIKLVLDGHEGALASDINEGPCQRARNNISRYGLDERISVVCRPGLDMIEDFAPDNIVICGMGGELIASILADSDYPKSSRCRLVLQPMSMQDVLRKYLCREGYEITDERVIFDEGKYYQLIAAHYDGVPRQLSECEYRLGRLNLARAEAGLSEVDRGWLDFVGRSAKRRMDGRSAAANPDEAGQRLDAELTALINRLLNSF